MTSLYFASSHSYAGKTLLALALGQIYQEKGARVGYFKPLGSFATPVGIRSVDEDVLFARKFLQLEDPPELMCPFILTEDFIHSYLRGESGDFIGQIHFAFEQVSRDKDVMLIGSAGQPFSRGALINLPGPAIADMFNAKVLLIGHTASLLDLDALFAAVNMFGNRLLQIILNQVPVERLQFIREEIIPSLQQKGLPVLGALPQDALLHSISVKELAESLGAQVLCAEENLGELVERFRIGAMTLESALTHFRRDERKAVITGGDRSDIMLAALQTPTVCFILTGNLSPSPAVKARAAELGVPMLLVPEDTITTVERVEKLVFRLRVREPRKLQRARELIETCLDIDVLDKLIQ